MFTIGEFARHGRVSVRMLRHYDAIGLLRPARVDPHSGYRHYAADQLSVLNRIVALKDLGFGLEQVRTLLVEQIGPERVRGMLTLRRAELAERLAADTARLAEVEARLRTIESEGQMFTEDIVLKSVAATAVVELTGTAASFRPEDIGPAIRPLCAELGERLERLDGRDVDVTGPLVCYYDKPATEDDPVGLHAALPVATEPADPGGLRVARLPGAEQVATIVHRGPMSAVLPAWQALAHWMAEHGYRSAGLPREVYLHTPEDENEWVTELQEPVTAD